jgi:hypothetical protein
MTAAGWLLDALEIAAPRGRASPHDLIIGRARDGEAASGRA